MRVAWSRMILRNRSRACGVLAGRPLEGLDEADEGGERRAELMAGIGDEIDADTLAPLPFGQVVEDERDEVAHARALVDACEPGGEPALGRHALGELDLFRRATLCHPVEGGERDRGRGAGR